MKIRFPDYYTLIIPLFCMFMMPSCNKNGDTPQAQTVPVNGLIPLPSQLDYKDGDLGVDKEIVLVNSVQFQAATSVIEKALTETLGTSVLKSDSPTGKTNIQFVTDNSLDSSEYLVEVSLKGITVKASSGAGAFYAAQTIRQLIWNSMPGTKTVTFSLRLMTIRDKPQYAWRGFHMDVSRHLFTKEYIFGIIDWLAYYKLNKLHLHLTDDQGWRIQIDQFPLLTQTGAWRTFNHYDSVCMNLAKTDPDYQTDTRFIREMNGKQVYGGFYSKQDIRDIVAYASANFIEVIPEVDMPGHMSAAIRAYPYLSCVDSAGWGSEFSFPVCPCNDVVMDFSYKVWDEIADLFPSKYVHIGCDEVEKSTWASSPACQLFMQQHGMKGTNEIQSYFVKMLEQHMQSKGKTVIAWDDAIDGTVDSKVTMMYWRDWVKDSPQRCAANGNALIISDWSCFYLSDAPTDENLKKLFDYNPVSLFPANVVSKILGMQGCIWTEEIPSEAVFEQHAFPRMQALAEICWSPQRNWNSFRQRMKPHFAYLNQQQIRYTHPAWEN